MAFVKISSARPAWFWSFLLLLVLIPLPFGANRLWASDLLGALSGCLLFAMLLMPMPDLPGKPPRLRLFAAGAGFTLVTLWEFAQTLSFTPEAWHHPLWADAARLLGVSGGAISLAPDLFPETLVRFLAPPAIFLLAFHAARDRDNAKLIVRALAVAGVFYALYGLLAQAAGGDSILWYKKWAYQGFLTSTFVNKNSYAAYAGLGLLCSIVFVRDRIRHLRVKDPVLAQRSYFAALFASLSLADYAVLLSPAVFLAALALTGSRAGVASTFCGVIVLFLALAIFKRWSFKKWAILVGAILLLFVLFVGLGGDALLTRLENQRLGEDSATRLAAYALTKQAVADNPWFGFGLGSFDHAFRLYRDSTLPVWFHHAHNDYLEMMMDLGVPAAFLLFLSIGLMVSCCVEGVFRRKRDAIYPALAVAASALIGTHVMVDFSLHIPAIAATYAALLGLGVAQSFSSREEKKQAQNLAFRPAPPQKKPAPLPPSLPLAPEPEPLLLEEVIPEEPIAEIAEEAIAEETLPAAPAEEPLVEEAPVEEPPPEDFRQERSEKTVVEEPVVPEAPKTEEPKEEAPEAAPVPEAEKPEPAPTAENQDLVPRKPSPRNRRRKKKS